MGGERKKEENISLIPCISGRGDLKEKYEVFLIFTLSNASIVHLCTYIYIIWSNMTKFFFQISKIIILLLLHLILLQHETFTRKLANNSDEFERLLR